MTPALARVATLDALKRRGGKREEDEEKRKEEDEKTVPKTEKSNDLKSVHSLKAQSLSRGSARDLFQSAVKLVANSNNDEKQE